MLAATERRGLISSVPGIGAHEHVAVAGTEDIPETALLIDMGDDKREEREDDETQYGGRQNENDADAVEQTERMAESQGESEAGEGSEGEGGDNEDDDEDEDEQKERQLRAEHENPDDYE
jgi:hypothetical protein